LRARQGGLTVPVIDFMALPVSHQFGGAVQALFGLDHRAGRERLLSLCGPERSGLFTLIAFKLVCHPEQRAEDDGAINSGQVHDTPMISTSPKVFELKDWICPGNWKSVSVVSVRLVMTGTRHRIEYRCWSASACRPLCRDCSAVGRSALWDNAAEGCTGSH
jgi:hypothetical protein